MVEKKFWFYERVIVGESEKLKVKFSNPIGSYGQKYHRQIATREIEEPQLISRSRCNTFCIGACNGPKSCSVPKNLPDNNNIAHITVKYYNIAHKIDNIAQNTSFKRTTHRNVSNDIKNFNFYNKTSSSEEPNLYKTGYNMEVDCSIHKDIEKLRFVDSKSLFIRNFVPQMDQIFSIRVFYTFILYNEIKREFLQNHEKNFMINCKQIEFITNMPRDDENSQIDYTHLIVKVDNSFIGEGALCKRSECLRHVIQMNASKNLFGGSPQNSLKRECLTVIYNIIKNSERNGLTSFLLSEVCDYSRRKTDMEYHRFVFIAKSEVCDYSRSKTDMEYLQFVSIAKSEYSTLEHLKEDKLSGDQKQKLSILGQTGILMEIDIQKGHSMNDLGISNRLYSRNISNKKYYRQNIVLERNDKNFLELRTTPRNKCQISDIKNCNQYSNGKHKNYISISSICEKISGGESSEESFDEEHGCFFNEKPEQIQKLELSSFWQDSDSFPMECQDSEDIEDHISPNRLDNIAPRKETNSNNRIRNSESAMSIVIKSTDKALIDIQTKEKLITRNESKTIESAENIINNNIESSDRSLTLASSDTSQNRTYQKEKNEQLSPIKTNSPDSQMLKFSFQYFFSREQTKNHDDQANQILQTTISSRDQSCHLKNSTGSTFLRESFQNESLSNESECSTSDISLEEAAIETDIEQFQPENAMKSQEFHKNIENNSLEQYFLNLSGQDINTVLGFSTSLSTYCLKKDPVDTKRPVKTNVIAKTENDDQFISNVQNESGNSSNEGFMSGYKKETDNLKNFNHLVPSAQEHFLSETQFSNNKIPNYHTLKKLALYKTEICRSFEETGHCRYGTKCQFAHSPSEIRKVQRHPRYKTEICKTYWRDGTCPYGKRCCFIHKREDQDIEPDVIMGNQNEAQLKRSFHKENSQFINPFEHNLHPQYRTYDQTPLRTCQGPEEELDNFLQPIDIRSINQKQNNCEMTCGHTKANDLENIEIHNQSYDLEKFDKSSEKNSMMTDQIRYDHLTDEPLFEAHSEDKCPFPRVLFTHNLSPRVLPFTRQIPMKIFKSHDQTIMPVSSRAPGSMFIPDIDQGLADWVVGKLFNNEM